MKPENVIPTDALYTSLKALCPDKVPGLAELSQDLAWDPRFNDEDRDVCNYNAGVMTLLDRVIDATNMTTGDLSAYVICHRLREAEKDGNVDAARSDFPHIVEMTTDSIKDHDIYVSDMTGHGTRIWVASNLEDAVQSVIRSYHNFIVEYGKAPSPVYGPYNPLRDELNRLAQQKGGMMSHEQYVRNHRGMTFSSQKDRQQWDGVAVSWHIINMLDALEACPRPEPATVEETKK